MTKKRQPDIVLLTDVEGSMGIVGVLLAILDRLLWPRRAYPIREESHGACFFLILSFVWVYPVFGGAPFYKDPRWSIHWSLGWRWVASVILYLLFGILFELCMRAIPQPIAIKVRQ